MIVSAFATTPPVAPTTPAGPENARRAPSPLSVPSVDDGSASASATLRQSASYVGLLSAALASSPEDYARLIKRGFLDEAIVYAQNSYALIDYDKNLDNDGCKGLIESGVMEALKGVRSYGTPTIAEPNLRDELAMARAAAENAASALALLAAKPVVRPA